MMKQINLDHWPRCAAYGGPARAQGGAGPAGYGEGIGLSP